MTDSEIRSVLEDRLAAVEPRIQAACQRSGRLRGHVTLVAVSKTVAARVAALLPELGIRDLGESRPQELTRKARLLPNSGIRWHIIGHLQRNKVPEVLASAGPVHSVDSERLYREIAKEAEKARRTVEILFQVNGSREEGKGGFEYAELAELLKSPLLPHIEGVGFMTMAANFDDPELARPTFRELREFAAGQRIGRHLSMGMSNDFEVAIEEGATLIRIGSVLFEGLPGPETEK